MHSRVHMPTRRSFMKQAAAVAASAGMFIRSPCVLGATSSPDEEFSAQDLQAEFRELYQRLQISHYDVYARRPKREYDALFERMLKSFSRPLTRTEIVASYLKFIAYGNISHATTPDYFPVFNAYIGRGGKTMPLRFKVVKGTAYISANGSNLAQISRGDEILALNTEPMTAWLKRLGEYVPADSDYLEHAMLEEQFPIALWLELGAVENFDVRLRTVRGETLDVRVPARAWQEVQDTQKAQRDVSQVDWRKPEAKILEAGLGYLRPGPFFGSFDGDLNAPGLWDVSSFAAFIDGAFKDFIAKDAQRLLIDLRNNPGGDNSFSDLMVSWFADKPFRFCSDFRVKVSQAAIEANQKRMNNDPNNKESGSYKAAVEYKARKLGEVFSRDIPFAQPRTGTRFKGEVFMLINRQSYSNTVSVAAMSQDYKFATILGEETADMPTSYGAMEDFKLSRTGITVYFPKAFIIRPSGSLEPRGVVPDIAIDTPIVETAEDRVLKQALAIVTAPNSSR